jgi:threonine/homoserine/homoserine lactone efflux protein
LLDVIWPAVVLGLSAGLAPGPLMALVITQTLTHGVREGIIVAAAPILTDAPIIAASFLLLSRLSGLNILLGIIAAGGGAYVLYLALETFRLEPVYVDSSVKRPRSLLKGVAVNVLNPHPYLFWVTVGSPFLLKAFQRDARAPWLFLSMFYFLLVGSKIMLALVVGRFRHALAGKTYRYLMRFLGILLVIFALFLFRDALTEFGWWPR